MRRHLLTVLAALVCASCATPELEEELGSSSDELKRVKLPHPQGAFETTITADGTGCPAGTWTADLSSDGETFTVLFSAYEAAVSPGVKNAVKDCRLNIDLGSRDGTQFSVGSFYYQGYVLLEKPGMKARQVANYKFPDFRQRDQDKDEVTGPADKSYLFTDTVAPANRQWTRCRRKDNLKINTRLVLANDRDSTGDGYINTSSIDGTLSLRWALKWRHCQL
jgi:hypothetical protein